MGDKIRIRLFLDSGYAGGVREDYTEIDRFDWECMTEEDRVEMLNETASEYAHNYIDYGAEIVEDD